MWSGRPVQQALQVRQLPGPLAQCMSQREQRPVSATGNARLHPAAEPVEDHLLLAAAQDGVETAQHPARPGAVSSRTTRPASYAARTPYALVLQIGQ